MQNLYIYVFLIIYILVVIVGYVFVIDRLKYLKNKHIKHTKVEGLNIGSSRLTKIISIIFVLMIISTVFITLTFL